MQWLSLCAGACLLGAVHGCNDLSLWSGVFSAGEIGCGRRIPLQGGLWKSCDTGGKLAAFESKCGVDEVLGDCTEIETCFYAADEDLSTYPPVECSAGSAVQAYDVRQPLGNCQGIDNSVMSIECCELAVDWPRTEVHHTACFPAVNESLNNMIDVPYDCGAGALQKLEMVAGCGNATHRRMEYTCLYPPSTNPPDTTAPLSSAPPTDAPPTIAPPFSTSAPPTNPPPTNAPPTGAPSSRTPPEPTPPPATGAPPTAAPATGGPPARGTDAPATAPPHTAAPATAAPPGLPAAPLTFAPGSPGAARTPVPGTFGPVPAKAPPLLPPPPPPPPAAGSDAPATGAPRGGAPPAPDRRASSSFVPENERGRISAAVSLAASASAFTGGLGGSLVMMKGFTCEVDDVDVQEAVPLDWEFHPTRLAFGTTQRKYLLGAVIMNPVIILASMAVLFGVASAIQRLRRKTWRCAQGIVRAPGFLQLPTMFLVQGTTLVAARLAFFPEGQPAVALIGWAVLLVCTVLPALVYWFVIREIPVQCAFVADPKLVPGSPFLTPVTAASREMSADAPYTGWRRSLSIFLRGDKIAVNNDPASFFAERWEHLCEAFRPGWAAFALVESYQMITLAWLSAWRPSSHQACNIRNTLICILLFVFTSAVISTRPFSAPVDNCVTSVLSVLMFSAMLLMTVGIWVHAGAGNGFFVVSSYLLFVTAIVVFMKAILDILLYAADMYSARRRKVRTASRKRLNSLPHPSYMDSDNTTNSLSSTIGSPVEHLRTHLHGTKLTVSCDYQQISNNDLDDTLLPGNPLQLVTSHTRFSPKSNDMDNSVLHVPSHSPRVSPRMSPKPSPRVSPKNPEMETTYLASSQSPRSLHSPRSPHSPDVSPKMQEAQEADSTFAQAHSPKFALDSTDADRPMSRVYSMSRLASMTRAASMRRVSADSPTLTFSISPQAVAQRGHNSLDGTTGFPVLPHRSRTPRRHSLAQGSPVPDVEGGLDLSPSVSLPLFRDPYDTITSRLAASQMNATSRNARRSDWRNSAARPAGVAVRRQVTGQKGSRSSLQQ
ncbi:hypothetical protein DIPPA_13058 [Diplonema papillatum]|nr:hypothetical protein DIPPA_13058 [Diplonema papillatum]